MRVYVSLPINGRGEATFAEKYAAARERCKQIISHLQQQAEFKERTVFVHTFSLNPLHAATESEAMGRCIQAVLECDLVLLDTNWPLSKGCMLEYLAAKTYGIPTSTTETYGVPAGASRITCLWTVSQPPPASAQTAVVV